MADMKENGQKKIMKKSRFNWPRFKLPHRQVVFDKVHRTSVVVCVSISAIILIRLLVDIKHYYDVRYPVMKELAKLQQEDRMEEMQKEKEAELIRLQQEASQL